MKQYIGKPMTRDPDELLALEYIPHFMVRYIPKERRPGHPSNSQVLAVKRILNMRKSQPFNRCRGRDNRKVRLFEQTDDFSHSDKDHVCDECRCSRHAGSGTKGNFYGLGPETGLLGVGYCMWCIAASGIAPGLVLKNARQEVIRMQQYGSVNMDTEYAMKVHAEETALAESHVKAREEFDLVRRSLSELAHELTERVRPKVYAKTENGRELVDVDDKTLFNMRMAAAKTLSRLRLDDLKLDASKYVEVSHVLIAAQEAQQAVREAIAKTEELVVAKNVRGEQIETDMPISEYVWDIFASRWAQIWQAMKKNAGRLSK